MNRKVFVNGTFDVLHVGHTRLLRYAASCGNLLMVAIDTDERVKQKKGKDRPFNKIDDRAEMLYAIRGVNIVVPFATDNELRMIIREYSPDIMIVGSDWQGKEVVGSEFAKELRFFNRIGNYSTTRILENNGLCV